MDLPRNHVADGFVDGAVPGHPIEPGKTGRHDHHGIVSGPTACAGVADVKGALVVHCDVLRPEPPA